MRFSVGAAVMAALLVSAAAPGSLVAVGVPESDAWSVSGCTPAGRARPPGAAMSWQNGPSKETSDALERLQAVIEKNDQDLIGPWFDHDLEQYVVVLSADSRREADISRELTSAKGSLAVRVERSCTTKAALTQVEDQLRNRSWHPQAAEATFAFFIDAATSQVRVQLDLKNPELRQALIDRFGSLVSIEEGDMGRGSRGADSAPHWGGAGIRKTGETQATCTSGFAIDVGTPVQYRGIVTAGHCYGVNSNIYSGSYYFGRISRKQQYPTFDMALITDSTYGHSFYSDPSSIPVRQVQGSADPAFESTVCISGFITRQVCQAVVGSVNASYCDSAGCTGNLFYSTKYGGVTAFQLGDSGAPVYNAWGTGSGAIIRGMAIARFNRTAFYSHKESTIRWKFGAEIATD